MSLKLIYPAINCCNIRLPIIPMCISQININYYKLCKKLNNDQS